MNQIFLYTKVSLYDNEKDHTILYGTCTNRFQRFCYEGTEQTNVVFCEDFCEEENAIDFFITLHGYISHIPSIIFVFEDHESLHENLQLIFPFEKCDLILDKNNSAIINTMCKDYYFRLDEWIAYNLKLGFSGIIVFDNDKNKSNSLHEPEELFNNNESIVNICKKYPGKVFCVDFPYQRPCFVRHWNRLQFITSHVGIHAMKNKCRNIAIIDADEFIYLPKNPTMGIERFLDNYDTTICMKSNILTNKNNNDILNNNIIELAKYVGENKYTKVILHTSKVNDSDFFVSHHTHPSQIHVEKEDIIHYHCWMNRRYQYNNNMQQIDYLQKLMKS